MQEISLKNQDFVEIAKKVVYWDLHQISLSLNFSSKGEEYFMKPLYDRRGYFFSVMEVCILH